MAIKLQLPEQDICQLYQDGKDTYKIGQLYSCHGQTICRILAKHGIVKRNHSLCQRNTIVENELLTDYKNGMTLKDLRLKYGCGLVKIYRILKRYNIKPQRQHQKVSTQTIIDTYLDVGTVTDTAQILGLSLSVVSKHLHKAEIVVSENRKKGPEHHNWKGGITPQIDLLRHSSEFKEWRQMVYRRDHYNCKMPKCSKHGGLLNAHHIIPIYDDVSRIFDISNGITLCVQCHGKIAFHEHEFQDIFFEIVSRIS